MLETVVTATIPIVSLLITLIFGYLAQQASQRMKTGAAKDAALELVTAAETVARSLEQTLKPQLIAASRDGKLTAADAQTLKDAAMVQLHDQLSEQAKKVMQANATRVEDALQRAIESQVQQIQTEPKEVKP